MVTVTASLTPKSNKNPNVIKLKIFWKTTKKWTVADINNYRKSVPSITESLKQEEDWYPDGSSGKAKFTCEDFAIMVLVKFASKNGLPLKLKTESGLYRNIDLFDIEKNGKYVANEIGFAHMVMTTYGAPDMQRIKQNTMQIYKVANLKSGDILAEDHDAKGWLSRLLGNKTPTAHHIQVVVSRTFNTINIYQGNSNNQIHRPLTTIHKLMGENSADPEDATYAGLTVEMGRYASNADGTWNYINFNTKKQYTDKLKDFDMFSWNFMEFNN